MVNVNAESSYYDKIYIVSLWSGAGYYTTDFRVHANHELEALELVVAYAESHGFKNLLWDVCNIDEDFEDEFIYVDATIEGATEPYYVIAENLRIREEA